MQDKILTREILSKSLLALQLPPTQTPFKGLPASIRRGIYYDIKQVFVADSEISRLASHERRNCQRAGQDGVSQYLYFYRG
jgi:hypothetical protein